MTIEATATTLPAGWYSDPANTGGDRWWDGSAWTQHLRAPEAPERVLADDIPPAVLLPELPNVFSPMTAPTALVLSTPTADAQPEPVAIPEPPVTVAVQPPPTVAAPAVIPDPVAVATVAPTASVAVQPFPTFPPPALPTAAPVPAPVVATAPAPVAPAAAAPAPGPLAPLAPLAPLSTGPVALAPLAPVGAPPVIPAYDEYDLHADAVQMRPDIDVSNGSAVLALLFGAIAVGLACVGASILPFAPLWVSAAFLVALVFGSRALVRYRNREASIRWAPILGVVLGLVATVSVLFGGTVLSLVSFVVPQAPPAAVAPSSAPTTQVSGEPLVFPLNVSLTAQERSAQSLATSINRVYATGASKLPAGKAWPAALRMSGPAVLSSTGTRLATLPTGESVSYALAPNGKSYVLTIVGTNSAEVAHYNSLQNNFSYACPAGDQTCTPSN